MTISLDTNVIVRLFIDENPAQHQAALRCLETYDQIRISDVVMVETIYTLSYRYGLGRQVAADCVTQLWGFPTIQCNARLFEQALTHFIKHPALSIEDCYNTIYAELNAATPLMTFDRKLANQLQHADLLKV